MNILYGAPIKEKNQTELESKIKSFVGEGTIAPHLAIVRVGDNKRSTVYINQKQKFATSIGAVATVHAFDELISPSDLANEVKKLGADDSIHGIIVQMPLPESYSKEDIALVLASLPIDKDADGLTLTNAGLIFTGDSKMVVPATTRGVINMLAHYNIQVSGRHVVVVGRSNLVGKPTAHIMLGLGATVTICHSKTVGLESIIKNADIVIAAAGIPKLIKVGMVRDNQVLVDIGISVDGDGVIVGDIDFENVSNVLGENGHISPVPGGVGPLTVSGLFQNLVDLYTREV